MQTIFSLNQAKNPLLFRQVLRAFRFSNDFEFHGSKTGVIKYRGLHWRIMSDDDIAVEIYGEAVTELPGPLKSASFELVYMYNFLYDAVCAEGFYEQPAAIAQVSIQCPAEDWIHEIAVQGATLQDANELYNQVVAGDLSPSHD
jgi:hypothetical protein